MGLLERFITDPGVFVPFCAVGLPIIGVFSVKLCKMYYHHRERMELIAAGIHPDYADEYEQQMASNEGDSVVVEAKLVG